MSLLLHLGLWVVEKSITLVWRTTWWSVKKIRNQPEPKEQIEQLMLKISDQEKKISQLTQEIESIKKE